MKTTYKKGDKVFDKYNTQATIVKVIPDSMSGFLPSYEVKYARHSEKNKTWREMEISKKKKSQNQWQNTAKQAKSARKGLFGEGYTPKGIAQLKKDHAALKKNPPKVVKEGEFHTVQIYSNVVKKYITVAEYTNPKTARADLKNFMKDHKETLAKILKLTKDVQLESLDEAIKTGMVKTKNKAGKTVMSFVYDSEEMAKKYNDGVHQSVKVSKKNGDPADGYMNWNPKGFQEGRPSLHNEATDPATRKKNLNKSLKGFLKDIDKKLNANKKSNSDIVKSTNKALEMQKKIILSMMKESLNETRDIDDDYGEKIKKIYAGKKKILQQQIRQMKTEYKNNDNALERKVMIAVIKQAQDFIKYADEEFNESVDVVPVLDKKNLKKTAIQQDDIDDEDAEDINQVLSNSKAFATKGRNGIGYGFESFVEGFGADTQKKDIEKSDKEWDALKKKYKNNKKLVDKACQYRKKNWKAAPAFEKAKKDLNINESINVVSILQEKLTRSDKQKLIDTLDSRLSGVKYDFGAGDSYKATYKGKTLTLTKAGKVYVSTIGNKTITSSTIDGAVLKNPKLTILEGKK